MSDDFLRDAAAGWRATTRPGVHAVVGDFHRHLGQIPADGRRLVAFLGGTIGNLGPDERQRSSSTSLHDGAGDRLCSAPTW